MHNKNMPMDDEAPATKKDIRMLEQSIKGIQKSLKGHAPKDTLKAFATKDDLKAFPTKDDLKAYATKEDLKAFATKDDLKAFATKDDLKAFPTKDDLKTFATKTDLTREIAVASAKLELKMDALAERLESNQEKFRSQVTTWVTTFLAKLEGVKNGETILVHRVDSLENRVNLLENRLTP